MFTKSKIIFWPVGTGDSISIVVKDGIVLQVDIRNLQSTEEEGDSHTAMVDTLIDNLPEVDGRPYLAAFALTHPDQDHVLGFADLLEAVNIGELWFTPCVFAENENDLCDDAVAFKDEVARRIKATIDAKNAVESGDRVRMIGHDTLLEEEEYKKFPNECLTVPGNSITEIDGTDYAGEFNAFIHAPFAEAIEDGDRNNTSLCMQIVLGDDPSKGGVLLFGDIAYPRIMQIFKKTKENENEQYLAWKIFLAPHHCSKSAMYQKKDDKVVLKQDMLDDLSSFQVDGGIVVSSSVEIPAQNSKGDDPPHAKAKKRYEEIADGGFLCTHEDADDGEPLVFELQNGELSAPDITESTASTVTASKLAHGVIKARGSDNPPSERVGYGS